MPPFREGAKKYFTEEEWNELNAWPNWETLLTPEERLDYDRYTMAGDAKGLADLARRMLRRRASMASEAQEAANVPVWQGPTQGPTQQQNHPVSGAQNWPQGPTPTPGMIRQQTAGGAQNWTQEPEWKVQALGHRASQSPAQQAQPSTASSSAPAAPPGVDTNWWNAFYWAPHPAGTQTVSQVTPLEYYGGDLQAALDDKAWSEQFQRTYGRPPTDDDWKWHWFAKRGGWPGQQTAQQQGNTPLQNIGLWPSGEGNPYSSPGPIYRW